MKEEMAGENHHKHSDHDSCCKAVLTSVAQRLDEMDFERGIWHAALYNDMPRLTKLLSEGKSPNVEDSSGYTALHYAARAGHYEICEALLNKGANPNVQTRCRKTTPLHRAAMYHHHNIIRLLKEHGADMNIQDVDGNTANFYASINLVKCQDGK